MSRDVAPILFLDFDGVVHPEPCRADQYFKSLPLIEAVLRRHPGVMVVLSTTWRLNHEIDELKERFSIDIEQRVIGVTPLLTEEDRAWYPTPLSQLRRQGEIEAWLHQHRTLSHPWIAIDDRPWGFESECQNLLVTNRIRGLTEMDADRLHHMILERLR
jgi:hypothetical protein